VADKSALG